MAKQTGSLSPSLTAEENKDLKLAQKLLVNILSPDIANEAAIHGYKDSDQQEGWDLYLKASGKHRSFSDSLSAARRKIILDQRPIADIIRDVDAFENLWLPRTRALLERKIHPDHREAFLVAFFDNLSQQPEGPTVLDSAEMLLNRVEALATDETPGAKEAFNTLTERGFNAALKQQIRDRIAQARVFNAPSSDTPTGGDAFDPVTALAHQREALAALRLWRNDWAEVFRPVLDYRILLRLGLRQSKGGRKPSEPTLKT